MTKAKFVYKKIAVLLASIVSLILFVCANTTSCGVIHQPKAPSSLEKFSKFRKL